MMAGYCSNPLGEPLWLYSIETTDNLKPEAADIDPDETP